MSLFLSNLAKCGLLFDIEDRDVKIINGLPTEVFSNPIPTTGIVKTVSGLSVFDDTNTEVQATHKICIVYDASVTSEKWILLNAKRLRILTVENCCEQNEKSILMCTERGTVSKIVNNG